MILIDERIAQARQDIDSGRRVIERQRSLIAMLKHQQRSTVFAESLLESFDRSQTILEADLAALGA
jgi:hypothetical protein